MFIIRTMSPADFEFAVHITDQMNWNMLKEDFEFATELEPEACFVLREDSQRIGLATNVTYGKVGWFGNLIVDERHREKGGGSQLVKHSINYLESHGVKTIGLYAYEHLIGFYEKLGFVKDSRFLILKGKPRIERSSSKTKKGKKQDIQKVIRLDQSCFGASRERLLESILSDPDNLFYVREQDQRIIGYGITKVGKKFAELGPLVCPAKESDLVLELLSAALSKLWDREVFMFVREGENEILDSLKSSGFNEEFRVMRMFRGPPVVKDCIYMAESLERG